MLFLLMVFPLLSQALESELGLLNKLPPNFSGFQDRDVQSFPDERFGASAGYWQLEGEQYTTLTVILYDGGYGPVETGITSPLSKQAFDSAISDIQTYEQRGFYRDVQEVSRSETSVSNLPVYFSEFKFNVERNGGYTGVKSFLLVTGVHGFLMKVRLTGDTSDLSEDRVFDIVTTVLRYFRHEDPLAR
ncbi:hypothetical protein [Oleiphilus messinensis]|nr:hypothetical protein [Oleiphilus messinensis]